jgi:enamine deaminase RidA (YjgF/YER057c/UK114 family)
MRRSYRTGGFEEVAAYSRAVRAGDYIAVSATAATGEDGRGLYEGDTYAQTRCAFERALEAVTELGGAAADVLRTRMYLGPDADWRRAVDAHAELFDGVFPANSTYFVAGFVPANVLVEVEVDAILSS